MTRIHYLLDTNIVSYLIKRSPLAVEARFLSTDPSTIAISAITEGELLYGLARTPQATRARTLVTAFLANILIEPWSSEAAAHYGRLRAAHERTGRTIHVLDLQIAAHALALGVVLVSRDHVFRDIPELVYEDWTRS